MRTLLVFDDESEIRRGIIQGFNWQEQPYKIIGEAANGQQAIDFIQVSVPDIILLDIVMPIMNGIDLTSYLTKHYPQISVVILSNYSDFSYVKQALLNGAKNYLLKATLNESELFNTLDTLPIQETLENQPQRSIEEQLKDRFFSNHAIHKNDIQDSLFQYPYQTLLVTDLLFYEEDFVLKNKLTLTDLFPYSNIYWLTIQNYVIIIIDSKLVTTAINEAMVSYLQTIGFHDFFGYLRPFFDGNAQAPSLTFINDSPLNQRFYLNDQQIVTDETVITIQRLPIFSYETFHSFLNSLEEEAALNYCFRYLTLLDHQLFDEHEMKDFFSNLFYQLFQHIEKFYSAYSLVNINKVTTLSIINNSLTYKKLIENVQTQFTHFEQLFYSFKSNHHEQLKQELIKFIKENASKKITLRDAADFFHFNYTYFSSFFSQHFDLNFTDFLTRIRIEKAKTLLTEHKQNISEISAAVGFSDISYFSRVFKKETGYSPSTYRRKGVHVD